MSIENIPKYKEFCKFPPKTESCFLQTGMLC